MPNPAYLSGWTKRIPLVIQDWPRKPLTNFVLPIHISADANLQTYPDSAGHCLRLCGSDGTTPVAFERLKFDKTAGNLTIAIALSLTTHLDSEYYLYIDNSSASDASTSVFPSMFKLALTLDENPTAGAPQFVDHSPSGNNGTAGGSMVSGDSVAGILDNGASFDTNKYITCPASGVPVGANNISVSLWMYQRTRAAELNSALVCIGSAGGKEFVVQGALIGGATYVFTDGVAIALAMTGSDIPTLNAWHHICLTYDGGSIVYYLDGVLRFGSAQSVNTAAINEILIGRRNDGTNHGTVDAIIDQVYITNTCLPVEYIEYLYRSLKFSVARKEPLQSSSDVTPSGSLTRTTTGLIYQTDLSDVSSWIGGTHWAKDSTVPFLSSWPSAVKFMTSLDGGGNRELYATKLSDGRFHVQYATQYHTPAGGNYPNGVGELWQPKMAQSFIPEDAGWVRMGAPQGLTGGINPVVDVSSAVYTRDNSTWIFNPLLGTGVTAPGPGHIPALPYTSATFTASSPLGPWTYIRDTPPLTPGEVNAQESLIGHIVNIGGTIIAYLSVSSGVALARATASSDTGAFALDPANTIIVSSAITAAQENPRFVYSAVLNQDILISNRIGVTYTEDNDSIHGNHVTDTSLPGWNYAVRHGHLGYDATEAIGCFAPFVDQQMVAIQETDGSFGGCYDGTPTSPLSGDANNTANHYTRQGFQCQFEAQANAFGYIAPVVGTSSDDLVLHAAAHTTVVFECTIEWQDVSGTTNAVEIWWAKDSATTQGASNGYKARLTAGGACSLKKTVAGTDSNLQTGAARTTWSNIDANNYRYERCRVEFDGAGRSKVFVEGVGEIDFTDSSSPFTSGTHVGFAGDGSKVRIRSVRAYKGKTVTVANCPANAVCYLRGASGTVFDKQTADGSGNVTFTSDHYPMYKVTVAGVDFAPADAGLIYGGDAFSLPSATGGLLLSKRRKVLSRAAA